MALNVDKNLRDGYRRLPDRSSLARLLKAERESGTGGAPRDCP